MERDIMANFLALGGLACASYGLRGLRNIQLVNIFSLLVSVVCVSALFISQMAAGIMLFFIGILVWFIVILIRTPRSNEEVCFSCVAVFMVLWVVLHSGIIGRSITTITETTQYGVDMRIPSLSGLFGVNSRILIAGIGFGNFSAIFPQYRIFSRSPDELNSPQSDLLWLLAEGGMVFFVGLLVCLFGFIQIFKEKIRFEYTLSKNCISVCVCIYSSHSCSDAGTSFWAYVLCASISWISAARRVIETKPSIFAQVEAGRLFSIVERFVLDCG